MRNEIMRGEIGRLLKIAREERKLTREDVAEGVIALEELRLLENGENDWDFWEVIILLGRLHIPDSAASFYLCGEDNYLLNLETEIRLDLSLWRYEMAEAKLKEYYKKRDKKNRFQIMEYWRMWADLSVRIGGQMQSGDMFRAFAEKEIPFLEERLHSGKLLSPNELAFITSYYRFTIGDITEQVKKLYKVVNYFHEEFATMEEQYPFYAMLMLVYAQCQYELGEYRGCVHQCREGLRVSVYSKFCKMGGELYELMADAKGKQMEEEIPEELEREGRIKEILRDYMLADTLYSVFYYNYKGNYQKKVMEKVERWKIMISN